MAAEKHGTFAEEVAEATAWSRPLQADLAEFLSLWYRVARAEATLESKVKKAAVHERDRRPAPA